MRGVVPATLLRLIFWDCCLLECRGRETKRLGSDENFFTRPELSESVQLVGRRSGKSAK